MDETGAVEGDCPKNGEPNGNEIENDMKILGCMLGCCKGT